MPSAVTDGIRVTVEATYLEEQSQPRVGQYVFAYRVEIVNESDTPAQLLSRHWIINDANGHEEHVQGDGVVGRQPVIRPGQRHEYTSFCPLATPWGAMQGTYRMRRPDGTEFDAVIPAFTLALPHSLN